MRSSKIGFLEWIVPVYILITRNVIRMNQTFLQRKDYNESIPSHIILALFPHALKLVMASMITTLVFITYFKRQEVRFLKLLIVVESQ